MIKIITGLELSNVSATKLEGFLYFRDVINNNKENNNKKCS